MEGTGSTGWGVDLGARLRCLTLPCRQAKCSAGSFHPSPHIRGMKSAWHHFQAVVVTWGCHRSPLRVSQESFPPLQPGLRVRPHFPAMLLLPLLLKATLLHLASGSYRPFYNGFYYNHIMNDDGNGQDKGILGTVGAGRLSQEAEVPPCFWVGWRPITWWDVGPRGAGGNAPEILGGCSW